MYRTLASNGFSFLSAFEGQSITSQCTVHLLSNACVKSAGLVSSLCFYGGNAAHITMHLLPCQAILCARSELRLSDQWCVRDVCLSIWICLSKWVCFLMFLSFFIEIIFVTRIRNLGLCLCCNPFGYITTVKVTMTIFAVSNFCLTAWAWQAIQLCLSMEAQTVWL